MDHQYHPVPQASNRRKRRMPHVAGYVAWLSMQPALLLSRCPGETNGARQRPAFHGFTVWLFDGCDDENDDDDDDNFDDDDDDEEEEDDGGGVASGGCFGMVWSGDPSLQIF